MKANYLIKKFLISLGLMGFWTVWTISCGSKQSSFVPNENESLAFVNILEENQKIQEFLLQEETKLPDSKTILAKIQSAAATSQPVLQERLNSLSAKLTSVDFSDFSDPNREKAFLALSQFSDELAELAKFFPDSKGYYKFYCPMVEKSWFSKGLAVRNPYAPEMRDCGERLP